MSTLFNWFLFFSFRPSLQSWSVPPLANIRLYLSLVHTWVCVRKQNKIVLSDFEYIESHATEFVEAKDGSEGIPNDYYCLYAWKSLKWKFRHCCRRDIELTSSADTWFKFKCVSEMMIVPNCTSCAHNTVRRQKVERLNQWNRLLCDFSLRILCRCLFYVRPLFVGK